MVTSTQSGSSGDTYIHHIPGRLRVRCVSLRGRTELGPYLKSCLEAQPGIQRVEVSALTGSVKVFYQTESTTAKEILTWLQNRGLAPSDATLPANGTCASGPALRLDGPGAELARKLATMALEKAVERSVVLLVASLL